MNRIAEFAPWSKRRGLARVLCGVAGAMMAAASTLAQPVEVSPRMSVGDVWRYSASLDVLVNEESEGESEVGRIVQSAHVSLEAIREESDGALIVRGAFDRVTSVWRRGATQYEFSWTRPEGEAPTPAEELTGEQIEAMDDSAIFRAVYEALATRPFEVRVSDTGVIESLTGFATAIRLIALAEGLDNGALGMFLPPRLAESIAPIWTADGAREINEVGDTWTESRGIGLGAAGAIEFTTAWTADRVRRDQTLECSGAVSAEVMTPERPSETQPTVEVLRGVGKASLRWSLADGWLLQREESLDLVTRWALADIELGITQVSKRQLNRLD